jgi:hypothetical protein
VGKPVRGGGSACRSAAEAHGYDTPPTVAWLQNENAT